MDNKLIIVGDLHSQEKMPKHSQFIDFMDWFFAQEFNNENNQLLLLGDLTESVQASPELLAEYLEYFIHNSKFNYIYILQGNHDVSLASSILHIFRPIRHIKLIQDLTEMKFGNCECLLLPHYQSEMTDKVPMIEAYSNFRSDKTYDFCFTHVEDETEHFSKHYCDLSNLKVKQFMNGHIHTESVTKGGRFLGSPVLNSSTESNKTPLIASINIDTKEHSFIEVPKFLDYYEVSYPDSLPEVHIKYPIFTVTNSLDRLETIKHYSKLAEQKGYKFYSRKIFKKSTKSETLVTTSEKGKKKTVLEMFNDYILNNNVDTEVSKIGIEVLGKLGV